MRITSVFSFRLHCLLATFFLLMVNAGCKLPERTQQPAQEPECTAEAPCEEDLPACGNGLVEEGETCDDGNTSTEVCAYGETACEVCDGTCRITTGTTSFCGDGITDADNGEVCDDGNRIDNDDCNNVCQPKTCGNGTLDDGEECDDGNNINDDTCKNDCTSPVCGDGIMSTGETCDDGNAITELCAYGEESCDVCNSACQSVAGITSFCGDNVVDPAEEACDDGEANGLPSSDCRDDCVSISCGDGVIDHNEQCDEGSDNGDGHCSDACQEQPFLLKDINTVATSSSDGFVIGKINNLLIVLASASSYQVQLFSVDADTGKTTLLVNLGTSEPYDYGSIRFGANLNTDEHLYLFTELYETGTLWKTDGTPEGTLSVQSFNADCNSNSKVCFGDAGVVLPLVPPQAQPQIVFTGYDATFGYGLWVSDGTAMGTQPVFGNTSTSIRPTDIESLTPYEDAVYFIAETAATGEELWRTDGTEDGTEMLDEIYEGENGSISSLTATPLGLFFQARSETAGYEPHWFDGETIQMLSNVRANGSSYPVDFVTLDSLVCYSAEDDDHGEEVHCTDTETLETVLLHDISEGYRDSRPDALVATEDHIYFFARDTDYVFHLWQSDGTPAGTVQVYTDHPDIVETEDFEYTMMALGDRVVFNAKANEEGKYSIYQSQGTTELTTNLSSVTTRSYVYTQNWAQYDGLIYFMGDNGETGFEVFQTDGTPEGTVLTADINLASNSNLPPAKSIQLGDLILFTAEGDNLGEELFVSNGTSEGTFRLKDINTGGGSSFPWYMGIIDDTLIFSAYDEVSGRELWKTDGTADGTTQVAEIFPGNEESSWLAYGHVHEGYVFFSGNDDEGKELWKTNGTFQGTSRVKDIYPGASSGDSAQSSYPRNLASFQGKLYFSARGEDIGYELWESDGTQAGTQLLRDINEGYSSSYPYALTPTSNYMYFGARTADHDRELWCFNGTELNRLTDVNDTGAEPYVIATYGDTLFFSTSTEETGFELWVSEGTEATTYMLSDIHAGPEDAIPWPVAIENEKLYFAATSAELGRELYVLDMDALTHELVKDIQPGAGSGMLMADTWGERSFVKGRDGFYYFAAASSDEGIELWRTDGTEQGTYLFADLFPGLSSSYPISMVNMGDYLFFKAFHKDAGFEIWRYNFTE